MLDACGKFPPSGMMEGTLTDLGRYDECVDIDTMLEGDDDPVSTRMQGQYCSVILRPPLPPPPRFHTFCNQIPSLLSVSSQDSVRSPFPMLRPTHADALRFDRRLSGGWAKMLSTSTTHRFASVSVLLPSVLLTTYRPWFQSLPPNST